jgi:hypothetical protein
VADISITAANVAPGSAVIARGIAGAAITAGQAVYADAANNGIIKKANAATSAATAACVGIAVNNAAIGQPVNYVTSGVYTVGGTVAAAVPYAVSGANDGGICPTSDITVSGEILTVLMIGISATQAQIYNISPGVAHA